MARCFAKVSEGSVKSSNIIFTSPSGELYIILRFLLPQELIFGRSMLQKRTS